MKLHSGSNEHCRAHSSSDFCFVCSPAALRQTPPPAIWAYPLGEGSNFLHSSTGLCGGGGSTQHPRSLEKMHVKLPGEKAKWKQLGSRLHRCAQKCGEAARSVAEGFMLAQRPFLPTWV